MEALKAQFPATNFTLLAVVLALPLIGAFVNGVFGKRLGKAGVRLMALSALGGSFIAALATFLLLPKGEGGGTLAWTAWRWFSLNGRMGQTVPIDVAFSVDAMSATMMLVVTGVGFLIHLYSSEYMVKDPGYHRFFAYLNLFCFAMLTLVMADNMAVLFVGWEGVGLCSYLLIGFWFGEEKNATAGKKAFIVNRIGDFGLLVAMAILLYYTGSLRFAEINANARNLLDPVTIWPFGNLPIESQWDAANPGANAAYKAIVHLFLPEKGVQVYASTLVGLAMFLGAAGKSAQIPLYVWLPDAMAGPTPVSALIHAATMVTAGVYLVARTSAVFLMSPAAMATVAVLGCATAIFAASIGLFQHDLKKVLAYSTVSQLGFMFIGVGVGAFSAGFFHVFTHAFFKACLFLGAGSVIHSMHARIHDTDKSQDIRNMGGLKKFMPITRWTFLLSCFAIAGAPPLSGFWSKDEILWRAFSTKIVAPEVGRMEPLWTWPSWLGQGIYWVGVVAATMTAFYMFRAYFLTFHGEFRGWKIVAGWKEPKHGHGHDDHGHDDHHDHHDDGTPLEGPKPHESPLAMTLPLMVLAFFAVFAGFLMAEPIHIEPLGHMLSPVFTRAHDVVVLRAEGVEKLMWPMMGPGVAAFLGGTGAAMVVYLNKGGAPEESFKKAAPGLYRLIYDKWRIDELYDAVVVGMVDALADIFTAADKWLIDGVLAKLTAAIVAFFGTVLRTFQTGRVQVYGAAMALGLAGVGFFLVRPHADATVDDSKLRSAGEVVISAAPGPGYTYRWEGTGTEQKDFGVVREVRINVNPGETKDVKLHVRNAFAQEATHSFPITRPGRGFPSSAAPVPLVPGTVVPAGGGSIPAKDIPGLINPRGAQ
ncbi:NADH-quinone oxidoreductase subunit L [Polyangium mundeleinium]|uniref:NADH-quinone oxidoreductase subunit L n=1 Tax=Polyangium mundeleinium TaxID=2995306 RepID=A0ABT5EY65_9BACT|nr:NADH-quinone oxidoreductase subunit L [Polyangium mundeleinium]MDC0745750.1 NADH-quinone oxidoreductase subunit L [Polyangium mundeleinium]